MVGRSLLVVALVGVLAACSSAGQAPSLQAPPSTGGSPPPAEASSAAVDTAHFVVAWASTPDEVYLPLLMAIDAMKKQGYEASGQQVSSDDILFQGYASNAIQAGAGGLSQTANAVKAGVPIKIVGTRNANPAVYVAANEYEDCARLAGKPVGILSPKAIYTLFMNQYFEQNCPGVKYTPVTISDSVLRAQAMERGQIVATVLGLPDAIALNAQRPNAFTTVPFGSTLPGIGDEYLVANDETLSEHPDIVTAWITEELQAIRAIYTADEATLASLERTYFPDAKDESVLKTLIKDKFWYANGGLAGDGLERSLALFKLPGTRATLVDETAVQGALKALGPSNLTSR